MRKWRKLRFPKVTVQYAEPITFDVVAEPTKEQQVEAAQRVFDAVKEMYAGLDEKGRAGVLKSQKSPATTPQGSSGGV